MSTDTQQSKNVMKIGAGFALFGVLCPFFWISLFSGTSPQETWVFGLHSGCFIILGLIFLGKGWYDLKQSRARSPEN